MTAPPPRRSWWKKKRTWAAVLLWLALPALYLLSSGPLTYVALRGWTDRDATYAIHNPLGRYYSWPVIGPWLKAHDYWWGRLALRHNREAASD